MSPFLVALSISVIGAVRLVDVQKHTTHESQSNPANLVDITTDMQHNVFTKLGYKCCCDKRKSHMDDVRSKLGSGSAERSNYCAVVKTDKCGDVTIGESTLLSHSYESTDGKCEITASNYTGFKVLINDFVDITKHLQHAVFTEHGYKCCCDKRKGLKDDLKSIVASEHRANYCAVVKTAKCGDVKIGESPFPSHSYKSTDGQCEILRSNYDKFAQLYDDLVDITKQFESSKKLEGYKCCCDKQKGLRDWVRGIGAKERANYCTVVKTDKCGAVKVDETTEKAHSYESTDGKCEIKRSELPRLSMITGEYMRA